MDSLEIRSNGTFIKKDSNYYYFLYSNNLYRISINDLNSFQSVKEFTEFSDYYSSDSGIRVKYFEINNYNIILFSRNKAIELVNDYKIFAFIFNSDFTITYKYMMFDGLMNDNSKFNYLTDSLYFYLNYSYIDTYISQSITEYVTKERIYRLKLDGILSEIILIDQYNYTNVEMLEPEGDQLDYNFIFQDSILEENNTTEIIKNEITKQFETAKEQIQAANTSDIVNELKKINNSLIMLLEVM